jgi:hypothetical protein
MKYFNLIKHYSQYWPIHVILFLSIFLLIFIIKFLLSYKNNVIDYKIYNFYYNTFFISIYFLTFVLFLFYIRFSKIGTYFNLKEFLEKFLKLFFENNILLTLNILLLIFVCFILLHKLNNFLINEIFKRHLYLYNKLIAKDVLGFTIFDVIPYSFYVILTRYISGSYELFFSNLFYNNIVSVYFTFYENEQQREAFYKKTKKYEILCHKLPYYFLVFLIVFECVLNSFVIHFVFYYLPFYLVLYYFKKVSFFLAHTNDKTNRIIYERYYIENDILYINITDEEDGLLLNYMNLGFYIPGSHPKRYYARFRTEDQLNKDLKELVLWLEFIYGFEFHRRYIKIGDVLYKNENSGEILNIERWDVSYSK